MRLRGKIVCATLPVIVTAMLVLGTVTYAHLRTHSEHEILLQTRHLLDQAARHGNTLVQTAQANARLFASTRLIERYVRVEDEAERYELIQPALLRLFAGYRGAFPEYREIRLVLPDGFEDTRLAATGLINRTEDESDSAWFRRVQAVPKADIVVQFDNHADDGEFSLFVTRPIRLVDDDQVADWHPPTLRGYLSINASLASLVDTVRSARLGQRGYLLLLDQRGQTLASGGGALPHAFADTLLRDASTPDTLIHHPHTVLHGERTRIDGRWLHDNLLLLAVVPEAEFAYSARVLALTVGTVIFTATLLISCILLLSLRQLVLRPVGLLRDAAVAIGGGVASHFPACDRGDEIGELARAFRQMHKRVAESVDALTASHARIEQLAYCDELTGLPNRRCYIEHLGSTLAEADASCQRFAVLFLDLDEFKRVNDLLGHEAGDRLLCEVADRLRQCVRSHAPEASAAAQCARRLHSAAKRPASLVARLGGDEFTLCCRFDDDADVERLATAIVAAIRRPLDIAGHRFAVGTSIGIACWPADAQTVDELVKRADAAMYTAKAAGKNTWRRFDDAMHARTERQARLESALRLAVANCALTVVYQAQYATGEDRIIGVEALLRWHDSELGHISPAVFIPIAEESGLIGELGTWVLRTACRQWQSWVQDGLPPLRLGVNVSPRQLRGTDFVGQVETALGDFSMDASCLELEVTETCMMEAPAEAVSLLAHLRAQGVRIAMDDFGTGYSSLSALTTLPIDTLKIDRSFVTGVQTGSEGAKVIAAIVSLAHSLDLDIIAEGVETGAEREFLANRFCDYVQGYWFGRPIPSDEMTAVLKRANAVGANRWRKAG